MDLTLKVTNGTDKEIRFEVLVKGVSKGELMMERTDITKFADILFGRDYTMIKNQPKLKE